MFILFMHLVSIASAIATSCPDCSALCGCAAKSQPASVPLAKMQVAYVKCYEKYSVKQGAKVNVEAYYQCKMPQCDCMAEVNEALNNVRSPKVLTFFKTRAQLAIASTRPVQVCVAKMLGMSLKQFQGLRKQYQDIQDSFYNCYSEACGMTFALMRETANKCAVKNGLLTQGDIKNNRKVVVPIMAADQKTVTGSFNSVHGSSISFDQKTVTGSFNSVSGSSINFDQKTAIDSFNSVYASSVNFDQKTVDNSFNDVSGSNIIFDQDTNGVISTSIQDSIRASDIDFDQKTVDNSFNDVSGSTINFDQKTVDNSFNDVSGSNINFDQKTVGGSFNDVSGSNINFDQKTVGGSFNDVSGSNIDFDQKTVGGSFNDVSGSNIDFDQKTVGGSFNDVSGSNIDFDQKTVGGSFNDVSGSNIDFDQKTVGGSFNDVSGSNINFDQKTVTGSFNAVSGSSISFDQKTVENSFNAVSGSTIAFDQDDANEAACPDCESYCSCVMSKGKQAEIPLAKMQDAYVYCNQKYPQKPKGKKIEVDLRSYYKCKMPGCKCINELHKSLNYEMSDKAMDYFGYHNLLASAAREKVADCVAKKLGLAQPAFDALRKQYQNIQDSFAFCYTKECGASFGLMREMTGKCAIEHGLLSEDDAAKDRKVMIPIMAADQKTVTGSFNSVHSSAISFDQKTVTDSFNAVSGSSISFDQKKVSKSFNTVACSNIDFDQGYAGSKSGASKPRCVRKQPKQLQPAQKTVINSLNKVKNSQIDFDQGAGDDGYDQKTVLGSFNSVSSSNIDF